jgi:hypothetical protein
MNNEFPTIRGVWQVLIGCATWLIIRFPVFPSFFTAWGSTSVLLLNIALFLVPHTSGVMGAIAIFSRGPLPVTKRLQCTATLAQKRFLKPFEKLNFSTLVLNFFARTYVLHVIATSILAVSRCLLAPLGTF